MQAIHTDYNSGTSPVMFPTYSMSMNFQPQPHSSQHQQLHQSHHHHQQVHQPQQHQQQYSLSPMSPTHQLYDSDPSGSSSSSMVQRRRSGGSGAPSGASRRVSPDAMIPLDAPTQPRRYLTPSATSRKDVPAFFKRGSYGGSRLSDDEEDELADEPPLAPNATDQERIQWKRRQNTLAARRSRKRKLLQQQALEETAERLARERDVWKTRAETLRRLLISNGIICPDFED